VPVASGLPLSPATGTNTFGVSTRERPRSMEERTMPHAPRLPWIFDRAAALHLVDDDDALLEEVLALFITNGPSWLAAVERAIATGDSAALCESAHALKGAAGYLAAPHFVDAAQELETLGRDGHIHTARARWPAFAAVAGDVLTALTHAHAETYR